jgi:hypothetical protein
MPAKEKEQEEYELIPISPLRRLEKRIEEVESSSKSSDTGEIFKEVIDIVRMNQQIVDELAKANDALRIEISKLPSKIDDLVNNLNELISFIKASAIEEVAPYAGESVKPLADKMDALIETNRKAAENNQAVVSALEEIDKKLRRQSPSMPIRKPVFAPRTIPPRTS